MPNKGGPSMNSMRRKVKISSNKERNAKLKIEEAKAAVKLFNYGVIPLSRAKNAVNAAKKALKAITPQ